MEEIVIVAQAVTIVYLFMQYRGQLKMNEMMTATAASMLAFISRHSLLKEYEKWVTGDGRDVSEK